MPIDRERVLGAELPAGAASWGADDVILYHLGLGAGAAPTDPNELAYTYERDLKVPYYLLFYPDTQDMALYHLRQGRYASVKPNRHGRCAIRKLDMEVGLLDGWVRYWFEGELLPLPADLQRDLDAARRQAAEEKQRADAEQRRADELQQRLEVAERELRALRARQGQQ